MILTHFIELSALKTLGSTLAQDVEDSMSEFMRLKRSLGDHIGMELLTQSEVVNKNVEHIKQVVDENSKPTHLFTFRNCSI